MNACHHTDLIVHVAANTTLFFLCLAAVTIVEGIGAHDEITRNNKYSCTSPLVEIAERIARIMLIVSIYHHIVYNDYNMVVLQLILITYAGLTIASMARVTTSEEDSVYYEPSDEEESLDPTPVFMFIVFFASLACTVGALFCDIPIMIAQFVSSKVMNHVIFRALVCIVINY